MTSPVIDAFEFSRNKEFAEGDIAVTALPRLAAECTDTSGTLKWTVQGIADKAGHPAMKVTVAGPVKLICQRCLNPLPFDIAAESVIVLARDDADADSTESMLEDDDVDVIVGSAAFDVMYLIEDEALLALPLAPKHDVCPDERAAPVQKSEKVSPFAVLKNLKQ